MSDVGTASRIGALLASITSSTDDGTFACRHTLPLDSLELSVDGFGELRLPITRARARKLAKLTTPAPYGRGRETLVDPIVRDVGELRSRKLRLDRRRWSRTLKPALDEIRQSLGLPPGTLTARVDKLLVYGPGQFFKPHRDTEQSDDMIGTLVVVLPSPQKGGSLSVSHSGETRRFVTRATSDPTLVLYAFYATCEHEVRPVTEGYRVVLSHTLHFRPGEVESVDVAHPELRQALVAHLDRSTDDASGYRRTAEKLVYLLDHTYSRKSLAWNQLKGLDRTRTDALRAVAAELGLEWHLALVSVGETWSASIDEPDYYRNGYADWAYDDDAADAWEDDDDDVRDRRHSRNPDRPGNRLTAKIQYELEEMIERRASLEHWRDSSGRPPDLPTLFAHDDELCWTSDLERDLPEFEEYEGYMGNYGNTLEREYRRAALVLWPRRDRYRILAQGGATGGAVVRELARDAAALDADTLSAMVESLLEVWPGQKRESEPDTMRDALELARHLESPDQILELLHSVSISALVERDLPALIALGTRQGVRFCRDLFHRWLGPGNAHRKADPRWGAHRRAARSRWFAIEADPRRISWTTVLPVFPKHIEPHDDAAVWAFARTHGFDTLLELVQVEHASHHGHASPSARERWIEQERRDLLAMLDAAVLLDDPTRTAHVVDWIDAELNDYASAVLVPVLERIRDLPDRLYASAGIRSLLDRTRNVIDTRIDAATRDPNDWRIDAAPHCRCNDCQTLARFLKSRDRAVDLPLAKDRRRHLHGAIASLEIPVSHQTRRQGRPYVLELRKQPSLFESAARTAAEERAYAVRLGALRAKSCPSSTRPSVTRGE